MFNIKYPKALAIFFLSLLFLSCKKEENDTKNSTNNIFPCLVTSDMTLTKKNSTEPDYVVECMVSIRAQLKIEPGVRIRFKPGTGFKFEDGSTIIAIGSKLEPIIFDGVTSSSSWLGIHLESNDPRNYIENCVINGAGDGVLFGTTIGGFFYDVKSSIGITGKLKMKNCTIVTSNGNGIFIDQSASNVVIDSTKIAATKEFPIYAYGGLIKDSKIENSIFENNTKNFIGIFSTSSNEGIYEETEFKKATIPYFFTHNIEFNKPTTIFSGVRIFMQNDKGISVSGDGKLLISGTQTNPVQIRGEDSVAGFWKGVYITNKNNNEFNYLNISNGGSSEFYACPKTNIALLSGKLTINNSNSTSHDGSCQIANISNSELMNNSPSITQICD